MRKHDDKSLAVENRKSNRTLFALIAFVFLAFIVVPLNAQVHDHAAMTAEIDSSATSSQGFFGGLFNVYVPRSVCMNREAGLIWLHIVSDGLIAISYYSIPLALIYFVKRRGDLEFHWMFLLFAGFILFCGTTHVMSVLAIWKPYYWIDGLIKFATALISIATATLLWPLVPKAVALPSPGQLRVANEQLVKEIDERKRAEAAQIKLRDELELRVQERTAELATVNDSLRGQISARQEAEAERNRMFDLERAARTEAERVSRVKDEFLATLSHELRTPLNAILGWSQLLRGNEQSAETVERGLEAIERNSRVQVKLIEDLLDMSRIISGKIRLDVQRVELAPAIETAIEALKPAAEAKDIRLTTVLDPKASPISGDPNRLQQIVWNLVANSIKFTPKGGRVQVILQRINSHIEIVVADTGIGIPQDFQPYVFERFRQADASTTRSHTGLGLGLSIVRHLVELHGGDVTVKSEGTGKGATFTVKLPLTAVAETHEPERYHPAAEQHTAHFTAPKITGMRLLVVDDEPDARDLMKRVLEGYGATVRTAGSASEALNELMADVPDVLVSDLGMPEEDGYALIRKVRALPREKGGEVAAVALTAFARPEDRKRALLNGFQMHVSKPVEATELVTVLASLSTYKKN